MDNSSILTIDLVIIDQQSVGKRYLHLMDTVNVKRDDHLLTCEQFLKESHEVTQLANKKIKNKIGLFQVSGPIDNK
jgi:N-dimethylarginine dimethylaminohydrolase